MTKDNNTIKSGMIIIKEFPRTRLNNWISNLNSVANAMGVSTVSQENRDFIYADKINSVINLIQSLCRKSGSVEKIIEYDPETGDPITETKKVNFTISGTAEKNAIITAKFIDSIRDNYNDLVEWYNWYD